MTTREREERYLRESDCPGHERDGRSWFCVQRACRTS
jgi:hypothetical protein